MLSSCGDWWQTRSDVAWVVVGREALVDFERLRRLGQDDRSRAKVFPRRRRTDDVYDRGDGASGLPTKKCASPKQSGVLTAFLGIVLCVLMGLDSHLELESSWLEKGTKCCIQSN